MSKQNSNHRSLSTNRTTLHSQSLNAESKSKYCPFCPGKLDRKGFCCECYKREHFDPPDDSPEDIAKFKAYRDRRWLVDGWMSDGYSEEQAIAKVQHPAFIGIHLALSGLAQILADDWATEALRQLLIARDKATIQNLGHWIDVMRKPTTRKLGRRSNSGVSVQEEVLRLKLSGKTHRQIAIQLRTDRHHATEAYRQITKKIAAQQIEERRKFFSGGESALSKN